MLVYIHGNPGQTLKNLSKSTKIWSVRVIDGKGLEDTPKIFHVAAKSWFAARESALCFLGNVLDPGRLQITVTEDKVTAQTHKPWSLLKERDVRCSEKGIFVKKAVK